MRQSAAKRGGRSKESTMNGLMIRHKWKIATALLAVWGAAAWGQLPPGVGGKVDEAPPVETSACVGKTVQVDVQNYPDGAVSVRRDVVLGDDGQLIDHGTTNHYWPDGSTRGEFHYLCGVRHGPRITWFQNGAMWTKGAFYNGQEDGTWTMWYPDGNKSREFTVRRGTWHGLYQLWHPKGQLRMSVNFVDGLRQGPQQVWDEQGRLVSRVDYVDNLPQPSP